MKLEDTNECLHGVFAGDELIADSLKIQWVTSESEEITVYKPDILFKNNEFNNESLTIVSGRVEPAVLSLDHGEIVQFERFGFVRIEKKDHEVKCFFTHR